MSTVAKPEAGPGCIPAPTSPQPGFLKEETWASRVKEDPLVLSSSLILTDPIRSIFRSTSVLKYYFDYNFIQLIHLILFNFFIPFLHIIIIVSSCPCMFEDLKPTEDSAFTRSVTLPRHAGPCRLSGCFARTLGWSQLSHSFGAFWAAVPQEITAKNQLSFLRPGKSGKTGTFGSPVCDE